MAAPHESPSSLHGQPWSVWAEKLGRDSPLSDDQNALSKQVDAARLSKDGVTVTWIESTQQVYHSHRNELVWGMSWKRSALLAVCKVCKMAVKLQSLRHHMDMRHPEILAPPPAPPEPLEPVTEPSAPKGAKHSGIKAPLQKVDDPRKSKPAPRHKNEKRPPILSSVNSVMPVPFDKIPSPQQPPPAASPTYAGATKPVLTTPSPLTSPQQASTIMMTVSLDAGGSQMVQIHLPDLSPPILQPMVEPPSDQKVQFSPKKRKKSQTDKKNVPLKDREFNPDVHCGVWMTDDNRNCTRSLTCKSHTLSARRAVQGRSKKYDELLAEHKAAKDQGKCGVASSKPSSPPSLSSAKAALTRKLVESVQTWSNQRPAQSSLAASVPILARTLNAGLNMVEESYPPTISLPATDNGDSDFPQLLNELKIEVPGLTDGGLFHTVDDDLSNNHKPLVTVQSSGFAKADLGKALGEAREPNTKFRTPELKPLGTCSYTLRREGNASLPSWKYKRLRSRFAVAGKAAKEHYSIYQSQQALVNNVEQDYSASSYVPVDHSLSNFGIGDPYAQFTDISELTDEQLFNGDDGTDILSQALSASNVISRPQAQQYCTIRQQPVKQEVKPVSVKHEFVPVKEDTTIKFDYSSVKREVNAPSLNHDRNPKRMRADMNPQRNGVIQNHLILQALIGSTSSGKQEIYDRSTVMNHSGTVVDQRQQKNVQPVARQVVTRQPVQQQQSTVYRQIQQGSNVQTVQIQGSNVPGLVPLEGSNVKALPVKGVSMQKNVSAVTQGVQNNVIRTQQGTQFQVVQVQTKPPVQPVTPKSEDFGLDWQNLAPSISGGNQVVSNGHLDLDDSALLNDILSETFPDLGNLDFPDDLLGLDEPNPVNQVAPPPPPQQRVGVTQPPVSNMEITRTKVVIERRQSNPVQPAVVQSPIATSTLSQFGLASPPASVPRQNTNVGLNTGVACLSSPRSNLQQSPLTYQQIFNDQVINQIRLQPRSPSTDSAVLRMLQSPPQGIASLTAQRQDAGKS